MKTVQPGGTIGVVGGGQLGRMLAVAAKQMAYNVVVLSPETNSPAGQVADEHIQADYDDDVALVRFSDAVDVATVEFENIPVKTLEKIGEKVDVRPGPSVVLIAQNRLAEKSFLSSHQFPVAPFQAITSMEQIDQITAAACPGVLKTSSSGYDGKGQKVISSTEQLRTAWNALGEVDCVLEGFIEFECEFSVIVARNENEIAHYEPIRNDHHNHILDVSSSPSMLPQGASQQAIEVARGIAEALEYFGVLCVEFFLTIDGDIVVNEIAPRPHNSGHLTIEAHTTSQFEQQVRAVCNLPLGSTRQHTPAAMANLLGDVWNGGTPKWISALTSPGLSLHLYGKDSARPGRKMGHITCLNENLTSAVEAVRSARTELASVPAESDPIDALSSNELC